jgi:isoaspartyl peptidase/L-asparaginase-like protein (Ntn-hydrolase superfamily)
MDTTCDRRAALAGLMLGSAAAGCATRPGRDAPSAPPHGPLCLSTWNHGQVANAAAWASLESGGSALDAAEAAARAVELDCPDRTVGLGGRPDRDGVVTLDAAVMDDRNRSGSVLCVRGVEHPVSLARLVMERTPHAILVGDGARKFAESQGIPLLPDRLSPEMEAEWRKWLETSEYRPKVNVENHDTVGTLVLDRDGRMAASCSTSGLAWKMPGRVGDSPIVGAGLFIDSDAGGAVCTGLGEIVLRSLASFVAVESLRRGATPQEAADEAIRRVVRKNPNVADYQVGILVMDFSGRLGAAAVQKGFTYAVRDAGADLVLPAVVAD